MTGAEFRSARVQLGLQQNDVAQMFGKTVAEIATIEASSSVTATPATIAAQMIAATWNHS